MTLTRFVADLRQEHANFRGVVYKKWQIIVDIPQDRRPRCAYGALEGACVTTLGQ